MLGYYAEYLLVFYAPVPHNTRPRLKRVCKRFLIIGTDDMAHGDVQPPRGPSSWPTNRRGTRDKASRRAPCTRLERLENYHYWQLYSYSEESIRKKTKREKEREREVKLAVDKAIRKKNTLAISRLLEFHHRL